MTADYLMFWEFGWWNAKTFRQGVSKGIRSEECDSVCQLRAGGIIPGFSSQLAIIDRFPLSWVRRPSVVAEPPSLVSYLQCFSGDHGAIPKSLVMNQFFEKLPVNHILSIILSQSFTVSY